MIELIHIGVRDYIHVVDLAIGHIAAMKKFKENCGLQVCIQYLCRFDLLFF